jgi:transposase
MVTLGVDAHKRTHTIVAVDGRGRQLAVKTVRSGTKDHLGLLTWAEQMAKNAGDGGGLLWAIEDCRHLSRRLERDLLAAGQSIVRVPPKLMAHARDSADLWQVRPHRCAGGRPRCAAGAGPAGGPAGWPRPRGAAAG